MFSRPSSFNNSKNKYAIGSTFVFRYFKNVTQKNKKYSTSEVPAHKVTEDAIRERVIGQDVTIGGEINPNFKDALTQVKNEYPNTRTSMVPDFSWREHFTSRDVCLNRREDFAVVYMVPESLPLIIPYAFIGALAAFVIVFKTVGNDPEVSNYMKDDGYYPSAFFAQGDELRGKKGFQSEDDYSSILRWDRLMPFNVAWARSDNYSIAEDAAERWAGKELDAWIAEQKPEIEASISQLDE